MADGKQQQGVMPSMLDRLIDPQSGGTEWRHGYGVDQVLQVVRRDLEELLNTRRTATDVPAALKRLANSIYAFGLPDLISLNATTPGEREELAQALESTITRYEPRLHDIRARLVVSDADTKQRSVRFRIEAKVGADPAPEVAFETVLELTTGQHSVRPN